MVHYRQPYFPRCLLSLLHDSEALSWGETPAKPLYVRGELHLDGQVWLFVKYDDGLFRKVNM